MKSSSNLQEWIVRAEHDWESVQLLIKAKSKGYEIICFHCQQCIEKYLKALLVANNKDYPKIHDLVRLTNECLSINPELSDIQESLSELNEYAVAGRYPGEIVEYSDVEQSVIITRRARNLLRKILKIK